MSFYRDIGIERSKNAGAYWYHAFDWGRSVTKRYEGGVTTIQHVTHFHQGTLACIEKQWLNEIHQSILDCTPLESGIV
jgi:hypothetical protein